eukprot:CAMPEP_0194750688 /NCGR_PEP_ID=MMETSP0323_2-20130528/4794_1 /TAXON_ID=2866 ORGANISM="Crypthecodinium cohnii, Strain Seligo" /NCGR_SAMPLE_ID=MMETSP0323_2 /ASSEMBLY_ACC=CAM_ASM_000346 /LENGTH=45 /DNA_ID= /DNA_START= /DNA_END= /DNA_ORIENTATION=
MPKGHGHRSGNTSCCLDQANPSIDAANSPTLLLAAIVALSKPCAL